VDVKPLEADVHTEMVWVRIDPIPDLFWPEQVELICESLEEIKSHLLPKVE
jgi:hypothetical protein